MKKHFPYLFVLGYFLFFSCQSSKKEVKFSGPKEVVSGDTLNFKIPEFKFATQDGDSLTNEDLKGKIYALNFFFTSCPGTCPVVNGNLVSIHKKYLDNENFRMISVSIDPNYDQLDKLKTYAQGFEADTKKWMFLRNTEAYTHDFMKTRLYQPLVKDPNIPGGFDHSSRVLLVDENGQLRDFYEGTDKGEVEKLEGDIEILLSQLKTK